MNIIDYTTDWVKGEITQGTIMIVLGVIFTIVCFLIWKSGGGLIKGMIIPMLPVIFVFLGYGSWLYISKPQQLQKLTIVYENSHETFHQVEEERILKEKNSYLKFKLTWGIVLIIGLVLLFYTSKPYFKGVALGLLFFGFCALSVDTFLENRANIYYDNIQVLKHKKSQ